MGKLFGELAHQENGVIFAGIMGGFPDTHKRDEPKDALWFSKWTKDAHMRQSRLCPLIVLCSEVASQAEPWTGYGILGGPKYDSNHTLNPLIVLTYCENGRLTKG